jgi:hypothetical protein
MTRKELVALLEEAMGVCDDMYERVPNVDFDGDIEEYDGTPKQIDDALTFIDELFPEYFKELARLSDAIYKLENDQEIR